MASRVPGPAGGCMGVYDEDQPVGSVWCQENSVSSRRGRGSLGLICNVGGNFPAFDTPGSTGSNDFAQEVAEAKNGLSGALLTGCCFPLAFVPELSYKKGGRKFGARRKGARKHAACDLIAPEWTKIYAVAEGEIIRGPYRFYRGTFAIEVQHPNFIARYTEIKEVAVGLRVGSKISKGQVIAYVGKMYVDSMLHFELYRGDGTGRLTQRNNPPFQRRSDLINPTPFLDVWKKNLPS